MYIGGSNNNDDIIKANFQTSRKVFLSFVNGPDLMMSSLLFDPTMSVNIIDLYSTDLESWVIFWSITGVVVKLLELNDAISVTHSTTFDEATSAVALSGAGLLKTL